ncbi:hypothetical protein GOP47_0010436 [Adiantum capillus-veneris]|uniref:Uncharacterized protein n=1 Tax=Adiantum capillus-veneris TaxID=13818 RepID=A0A9D4UUQ1_ADICA|nr:hypothetical protein GOP47_0010436 [Adiantum capillus-veneris]
MLHVLLRTFACTISKMQHLPDAEGSRRIKRTLTLIALMYSVKIEVLNQACKTSEAIICMRRRNDGACRSVY